MQTSSSVISRLPGWTLEDAFPDVECGRAPLGSTVIVQLRMPKKSAGSLIMPDEVQDTERCNTQIAKVVAVSDTCFKDQKTMEPWPEGPWYRPGDYVSIPLYGGDRWWRQIPGKPRSEKVTFVLVGHLDIRCKVTADPLDEIVTV